MLCTSTRHHRRAQRVARRAFFAKRLALVRPNQALENLTTASQGRLLRLNITHGKFKLRIIITVRFSQSPTAGWNKPNATPVTVAVVPVAAKSAASTAVTASSNVARNTSVSALVGLVGGV